jgi:GMP reductase
MRIINEVMLDYDSVLIRPHRSTLTSRSDVDLERTFVFRNTENEFTGIPVMSANMDTTGTFDVANVLEQNKMFTCLHKHYDLEELYSYFFTPREYTAYSMGITETDLHKWETLKGRLPKGNVKYVCIDVANGYTEKFLDFVKQFKENNPDIVVIAGNVVTAEITEELILNGVDIVKVGIGPGSVCTTRIQTGVGYPQLSAVIECADAAHGLDGYIIADGGCTTPGDVAKAFAAGSDFVMLGGMFAGHTESGGETVVRDGEMFKAFYGMSSKKANESYNGGLQNYKASEGREVLVPFKGDIQDTINEILGGVRSTCTYVGASKLKYLSKRTTFIRCNNTHNKIFE